MEKKSGSALRWIRIAALVLILGDILPGTGFAGTLPEEPSRVGKTIPAISRVDQGGEAHRVPSGRKGCIEVVNFWGIRCGSCLQEIPKLEELYARYRARGLKVYGINADGVPGEMLWSLMQKSNLEILFPVLPDPEMEAMDLYQVMATPLTLILDSEGIVRYQHVGYNDGDEKTLETEILKVMDSDP